MTKQSSSAAQTEASPPPQDGRKLRSQRSREKIIDALFSLIRDGDPMPRIAEIADKAGVSLRTVFRHIEDVETLNREMAEQVEAEITPVVSAPLKATSWRGRLEEMLQRRAKIYEHVMPVKVAAGLRRFRSEFLMADYQRFLDEERTRLVAILPDAIIHNKTQLAALQMATSFQMWRRLRQDQGLSPEDALETLAFTVERLIQDG